MAEYNPVILQGQKTNDDEILAKSPLDAKALGGDSSVIIMELLQRFKVRDVMKRQVITIPRRATLRQAQVLMRDNRISGVPVCEDGRLFGIVSVNDIIRGLDGGWMDDPCERHMATNLVVLEAGMGGEFDATNVIPSPEVAVFTNIGLDHTDFLGDTVEKIAATKSGVIKSGCECVMYRSSASVEDVIENKCKSLGVPFTKADFDSLASVSISLEG
jgi:CBS domain-containing protein